MAEGKRVFQHWPVILMVLIVAAIFLIKMLTYQVDTTEYAIVLRFGEPQAETSRSRSPGLHFKLPWETVWRQDNRVQCFEGNMGEFEEIMTADGKNIVVSVFIGWKIGSNAEDQLMFMEKLGDLTTATDQLTELLRTYRSGVFGTVNFNTLVNIDAEKVKLDQVEDDILDAIAKDAKALYGIDVEFVGIRHLGFPDNVTTDVIKRMQAERQTKSAATKAEGEAKAMEIRSQADLNARKQMADAEVAAKATEAKAETEVARLYANFETEPELAKLLLRRETAKKIAANEMIIIMDANEEPWVMFQENTDNQPKDE